MRRGLAAPVLRIVSRMLRAHKIRLNPTPEQTVYFFRAAGIARFSWNWALDDYKRQKSEGLKADWNDAKKRFRLSIDEQFPFVRDVTKCAFEEAFSDLAKSVGTYYSAKKAGGRKVRFPGYRKRHKRIGGFGIANDKFRTNGHSIRIPRLGWVNMAEPLRYAGSIRTGRIVEGGGNWYAVIVVEVEKPVSTAEGSTGIDFGLKTFATLSTGEVYETQKTYRKGQRKLRALSRSLSRKKRGSANWKKQKARVGRFHRRLSDRRKDFLHKFTTAVTAKYAVVCIEDLNLRGMCRTNLSKSVNDAGIGISVKMLEYKADILQKVGRFYPSSKRCFECGAINANLKLSDRTWTCVCGSVNDRDHNASKNIELEGVSLLFRDGYTEVTPVKFGASTLVLGSKQASDCEAGTDRCAYFCTLER